MINQIQTRIHLACSDGHGLSADYSFIQFANKNAYATNGNIFVCVDLSKQLDEETLVGLQGYAIEYKQFKLVYKQTILSCKNGVLRVHHKTFGLISIPLIDVNKLIASKNIKQPLFYWWTKMNDIKFVSSFDKDEVVINPKMLKECMDAISVQGEKQTLHFTKSVEAKYSAHYYRVIPNDFLQGLTGASKALIVKPITK